MSDIKGELARAVEAAIEGCVDQIAAQNPDAVLTYNFDPDLALKAALASLGAQERLLQDLLAWPCEGRDCGHDLRHVDANHHEDGDGSGTWHCGHCWDKQLRIAFERGATEQREACAKFIEQASLHEGRPIHAARARATPLVEGWPAR